MKNSNESLLSTTTERMNGGNTMKNDSLLSAIGAIIATADKYRSSYFWTPPCNASGRRSMERRDSKPLVTWSENGHEYSAAFDVRCSCHNVYAAGSYTRDGKKTTLTAIRNSYSRLLAQ